MRNQSRNETIIPMHEMIAQPIRPWTHVMVVKNCDVSGSTIGYHGTVIRIIDSSVLENPDTPDCWSYRVYIPAIEAEFAIEGKKIIPTAELDDIATLGRTFKNLQFDFSSGEESHGAFRLNDDEWLHFHFKKHDANYDEHTISMAMNAEHPVTRRLNYRVRRESILDREYVLNAIKNIIASDQRQLNKPMDRSSRSDAS